MGKQNSIITFTGKLGNLIGYRRNGKHFLRSMPATVQQTVATRHAAQRFGLASRKGALIRHAFRSTLDVQCDSGHINRLTSALIPSAGREISSLTGFRFNQHTGTDKFLTLLPVLSPDGTLRIPPQVLPAYKGINAVEIKVIATRIHFATRQVVRTKSDVFLVKTGVPFKGAVCDVQVPGKGTLMIILQVRSIQHNMLSCNRKYLAADIIAVQPPQTPLPVSLKQHRPKLLLLNPVPEKITNTPAVQFFPSLIQLE